MALSDNLKRSLARVRTIGDRLGLRTCDVALCRETAPSQAAIMGDAPLTVSVVTSSLVHDDGSRPFVQRLGQSEIWSSGGKYFDGDLKVGPFTPTYVSGGFTVSGLRPSQIQDSSVYYTVEAPDEPSVGGRYNLVSFEGKGPLSFYIVLRRTSQL